MPPTDNLETLVSHVNNLDRDTVIGELGNFRGRLRLDFSLEFLRGQTLERLRHILLAAVLTDRRISV